MKKEWTTQDEINFILHISDTNLKKIMPALRSRDWGTLDEKKIMAVAERRFRGKKSDKLSEKKR